MVCPNCNNSFPASEYTVCPNCGKPWRDSYWGTDTTSPIYIGRVHDVGYPSGNPSTNRRKIEEALNAANPGDTVRLSYGAKYPVNSGGRTIVAFTFTTGAAQKYAVKIPNGVTFDQNGATLVAAEPDMLVVVNEHPATGTPDIIGWRNAVVDGNNLDMVNPNGVVELYNLSKSKIDNIEIVNGVKQLLYVGLADLCRFGDMFGDTCAGNGLGFGNRSGSVFMTRCSFGVIEVNNCGIWSPNPTNFPGNPIGGAIQTSTWQKMICYGNTAGIKMLGGSRDSLIDSVLIHGSTDTGGNSGFKLQGDDAVNTVDRMHVGEVTAIDQAGMGAYIEQANDCSIASYTGQNNASGAAYPDFWMGTGRGNQVALLRSSNATRVGVDVRAGAQEAGFGDIYVYRCNAINQGGIVGYSSAAGSDSHADRIVCTDDRGVAQQTRGIGATATSKLRVGRVKVTGWTITPVDIPAGLSEKRGIVTGPPYECRVAITAEGTPA